jgi:hypothetical protein
VKSETAHCQKAGYAVKYCELRYREPDSGQWMREVRSLVHSSMRLLAIMCAVFVKTVFFKTAARSFV